MVGGNRFTRVLASDNAKWNSMKRNLSSLHNKFIFNSAIPLLEIYRNIHRKNLKCFMQKSIPYGIICNNKIFSGFTVPFSYYVMSLHISPFVDTCITEYKLSKVTCSAKIITQIIKVTQSTARCFYETLWQLN